MVAPPVEEPRKALMKPPRSRPRIDEFLAGLSILPVRASRIVEVRYASTDPVFAA